jgi:hypothetical protein
VILNGTGDGSVLAGVYENYFYSLVTATNQVGDYGVMVNAAEFPNVMYMLHGEGVGFTWPYIHATGKLNYYFGTSDVLYHRLLSGSQQASGDLHLASTTSATRGRIYLYGTMANVESSLESTGVGTAQFGTNSPAVTLTAPYKWLTVVTSDGSTCYIPMWK